jgi:hypothetical protein
MLLEDVASLIDKLSIENCRLWALQDQLMGGKLSDVDKGKVAEKIVVSNKRRSQIKNQLMHSLIATIQEVSNSGHSSYIEELKSYGE